jgi:uncharacterized protein
MLRSYLKYKSPIIQLIIFLGILLLFMLLGQLLTILVVPSILGLSLPQMESIVSGNFSHPSSKKVLMAAQAMSVLSLFVGTAYVYAKLANKSATKYLNLHRFSASSFGFVVLLVLLSLPVAGLLGKFNSYLPLPASFQRLEDMGTKAVEFLVSGNSFFDYFIGIIVIAMFAAISEELLFRGVLQRILIQGVKNPVIGIIITAIIFSAFHMQFKGFLPRFYLGVVLGFIYWYTQSLWPAILFHFLYNGIGVTAANFVNKATLEKADQGPSSLVFLIAIGAFCAYGVWQLLKQLGKQSRSTYAGWYPPQPSPFDRDLT